MIYIDGTGQRIKVHDLECCDGQFCPIHNPSDHVLKNAPTHWRFDKGIMERICKHGVGHPDPDCLYAQYDSIHGCDGCCNESYKEIT